MAKINCFYISHCSEIMKNNIVVSKVKTKLLIHNPNFKPNRIIDRTYRLFNVFPRTDKTYRSTNVRTWLTGLKNNGGIKSYPGILNPLQPSVAFHVENSHLFCFSLFFFFFFFFFFYQRFVSQLFTNHRTAGEGGGHFFNSSLPLRPASQTLTH